MKKLILALVVGLFTTQIKAQDCVKYVAPKWQNEIYDIGEEYNANDYEFRMVVAGVPPVTKTHYKKVITKDGFTGIDSVKTKLNGKLCTMWVEPTYAVVVDWVETIKPAIMPQFAFIRKTTTKQATYTKQKNYKDGRLAISECDN